MDTSKAEDRKTSVLNNDDFWEIIKDAYTKDTSTQEQGAIKEIQCIRPAMVEHFENGKGNAGRYVIVGFLGVGGVGIVFKSWDTLLHTFRAIKIARPIEGKEDLIHGLITEEINNLQEVNHPNIISIFDIGTIKSTSDELPFYAMTFLRGAINAHRYFSTKHKTEELFKFINGLIDGTAHLHSMHLVHLDLKPHNVFVGEDGYAVIGDLGGTRKKDGNGEDDILVTCTTKYAHPVLEAATAVTSEEDNRRRGHITRKELMYEFDRYAIGKSLFEIIKEFERVNPGVLTSYQRKYLLLQAARLLDGKTSIEERPLGLTEDTLSRIKYGSIQEARTDFDKLLGRVNFINEVPEITPASDSIIQVTKGRRTRLTPRLTRLLREPLVRRLSSISQLGLVRLVYPGAVHTRFEHSLGAYSNAALYIRSLYYDPINPLFRQIMSKDDLIATLLAALLHDLGQYQHAHDLQDVEPAVFKHETLTLALLKGTWQDYSKLTDSLRILISKDWGIESGRIVDILEANPEKLHLDLRNRILHTIISGPLDVDKLDYLLRDSDNCQTGFGNGLDRSRLVSTFTVVYQRKGASDEQYFALGIHEKGRAAAESVGFIRFQMFSAVYWHHTVRAAKAMLERAAFEWMAPHDHDASLHDKLKHELHDFILQFKKSDKTTNQGLPLFAQQEENYTQPIGHASKPQWSTLCHTDMQFLQWLYQRSTQTGKDLIEGIARRELYKRVFVISAAQDKSLWDKLQKDIKDYEQLRTRSEQLRKSLKSKVDAIIKKQKEKGPMHFYVTGLGEETDNVEAAAKILGKEGTVLIDIPKTRGKEELLFYPEELHRGQKEEFEAPSLLSVSELWDLVSRRLHETAGNIRIFVHPDIAILKSAKIRTGKRILDAQTIEEEINNVFSS